MGRAAFYSKDKCVLVNRMRTSGLLGLTRHSRQCDCKGADLRRRLSAELGDGRAGERCRELAAVRQIPKSLLCVRLDLSTVSFWTPVGRVAKMAFVNSAVKPPRDVRRRQEKFGTGGALVPEKTK